MARVRVHSFALSLDGFAAGPDQDADHPLGVGGARLHEWIFATRHGRMMIGRPGGSEGVDDGYFARRQVGVGATVMGRNMFGPVRGPWGDSDWAGWWGDDPPFHHPVFVLTHHPRPDIEMAGGTTFHFVTDGPEAALARALAAAGGADVVVGGGAATVGWYLAAGLIDQIHLVQVPVLLGSGERLVDHLAAVAGRYEVTERTGSEAVTHLVLTRTGAGIPG